MKKRIGFVLLLLTVVMLGTAFAEAGRKIPFTQIDLKDGINVTSVNEYKGPYKGIEITYTAKKDYKVITFFVKVKYKDGKEEDVDNQENNVKKGKTYDPDMNTGGNKRDPSTISSVEIRIKEFSKSDCDIIEKAEKAAKSANTVLGNLSSENARKVASYFGTLANVLGKVNSGMELYKTAKDLSDAYTWSANYARSKSDQEKLNAGKKTNEAILKMLPKLAGLVNPGYGIVVGRVVEMMSATLDAMALYNAEQSMTLIATDNGRYYDLITSPYKNIAIEMYTKGASLSDMEQAIKSLEEIAKITGQK